MVSHYTMQQQLRKIEYTLSQEERMYKILEVYMNLFPPEFDSFEAILGK